MLFSLPRIPAIILQPVHTAGPVAEQTNGAYNSLTDVMDVTSSGTEGDKLEKDITPNARTL